MGVLPNRPAGQDEGQHDRAHADRVDRGLLVSLRPKKNIVAAPKAGSSGMIQMMQEESSSLSCFNSV